jgi:hypothetical protein
VKVIDVSDQSRPDPRLLVSEFAQSLAEDRFARRLDQQEQRIRRKLEQLRRLMEQRQ